LLKDRGIEDADKGKVAIALLIIQAIADHERIRNVEAGVFDGQLNPPMGALIEEGTNVEVRRMAGHEVVPKVLKSENRVDNVFDNQHVLTGDALRQVLEDVDLP
jgi:hypothetical protein